MTCLSVTEPKTLPYYTRREGSRDYAEYWAPKADPDGNVRDRSTCAEELQYCGDMRDEILWLQQIDPGMILDVGAGRGWLLGFLDKQWLKHATEICPIARKACAESGVEIRYPDLALNPWTERYDAIVCHHVIEHVEQPEEMLRQIHRLLKPGGKLLLATPDFASPCAKRFGDNYRMLHDETHVSLFTLDSMHRMLRDFGFTIQEVRFPFPERYATAETMEKWRDTSKVSPPWPGNHVTFYCKKETTIDDDSRELA